MADTYFRYFVDGQYTDTKPAEGVAYERHEIMTGEFEGHVLGREFFSTLTGIQPTEIIITSVTGAMNHNSELTHITCTELADLVVTGTVAIEDQTFSMPLKRDDGRLILFPVEVVGGSFTATLNFPTSGQFVYSNLQANHDLPEPLFKVNTIKVDVLRVVGVA